MAESEGYKAESLSIEEFVKRHKKVPVVLQAQSDCFALLKDPEDLRKWEKEVRERVGLGHLNFAALSETCSESGCPTNDCDTD